MMPMPCGYHYLQKTALPRKALAAKKLKFQNADLSIYIAVYCTRVYQSLIVDNDLVEGDNN